MVFTVLNVIFKFRLYQRMPRRPKRKIHTNLNKSFVIPHKKIKSDTSINPPNLKKNKSSTMPLYSHNLNNNPEILNSPVKSLNDKKEYKVIKLENGLVACLVSDLSEDSSINVRQDDSDSDDNNSIFETDDDDYESSEKGNESLGTEDEDDESKMMDRLHGKQDVEEKLAAASLTIGVGSFSDPDSIPGMAHFLEHMVFMGSEKYPQENDFDAFLKKRGGSDNASTDCESTTFYFECLEKHLYKALDKFAQFFISPLMKRDTMTREREAIESEFQMALPSDSYRKEQLLASLSQPNSPVNKFLWGNLITLRDNVDDDKLYDMVHEFRKRHYSAHRMTLAIQARLPLNELEQFVISCFSNVPTNKLPAEDFQPYAADIYNTQNFNRLYYVKPVKDVCQVDLTWCLPSLLKEYKSKPHQYIAWLIGHEGKGSLYSYLRNKMWALSINTGNGETGIEHNSIYALFTITLVLTKEGLTHIYEVIEAVFSYLYLLKRVGPQERIYDEIKTVEDTSFRFQDEEDAVDFVENLSEAMQFYPPEDYLTGDDLYFEYNPEGITSILNKLDPRKMNVMVLSTSLPEEIQYDKVEKWFSTSYTDREIPEEWIEGWSNVEPYNNFSLPETNKYLTTDFSLLEQCKCSANNIPLYPDKILSSDLVELWFKPDNKFKQPIAYMNFYLISPMCQESAINSCMVDLFIGILLIQLAEDIYPAYVAELGSSITVGDYGIIIKVEGYNQKLSLLLELIVNFIKNMSNNLTVDLFNAIKDKQKKTYYNAFIKPSKLSRILRLSVLMNTYWSPLAKYHAISNIEYSDFINFNDKFLRKFHVQALIQGNINKENALTTTNNIINILGCGPVQISAIPKARVTEIPTGKHYCKVMSYNQDDVNSIITNYYQSGPGTLKSTVIIEIIMLLMEEPLFDVLRTKEQLGYHVYCTVTNTCGIIGFTITVNAQATKSTTEFVNERMEVFLKRLVKNVKKMSDKKINKVKLDLIKVKQLADVHLKEEVSRNWSEIYNQEFMFDRVTREISAVESVKVSDVRKNLEQYTMDNNNIKKLSIQVAGHKTKNDKVSNNIIGEADITDFAIKYVISNEAPNDHAPISNIYEFKQKLNLYPFHQILD